MIEANSDQRIEDIIRDKGEITVCSSGISMYPLLRHRRDMVVVSRVDRPLEVGDVPVYRMPSGKIIMHRILKVRENDYIIRGDNTFVLEYIPKDYIIGVMRAVCRDGKYLDCQNSRKYKVYVFLNRYSYPFRKIWNYPVRPALCKIKRILFARSK